MAALPLRPLRFYEIWMLKFLSRSPRIHQIIVVQDALPPTPASPEVVNYLDACYQAEL
jgi:hypothetical protein